jgi:hypothetical protein
MKRLGLVAVPLVLVLTCTALAHDANTDSRCMKLRDGGFAIEACLEGTDAPRHEEISTRRTAHGVEDFLLYGSAPRLPRAVYALHAPPGSTIAVDASGAAWLSDGQGHARLRIDRPWVRDAEGTQRFARLLANRCEPDGTCGIAVDWSGIAVRYPLLVDPTWTVLPNEFLCSPRQFHTATAIGSNAAFAAGSVLIVGGLDDTDQPTASVALYTPTGSAPHIVQCKSLAHARAYHTATWVRVPGAGGALQGKVLIVGGYGSCADGPICDPSEMLDTYELYDPSINCNSSISCAGCDCPAGMDVELPLPDGMPRAEHSATVLGGDLDAGGAVIIAGGANASQSSVLRFETDGTWTVLPATVPSRFGHTATYVKPMSGGSNPNPLVFLAGGSTTPLGAPSPSYADSDLILTPPWTAAMVAPHDTSAGAAAARPARSGSASLVEPERVFLWGGSASTPAETVDFDPYFNGASTPTRKTVSPDPATQFARNSVAVDTVAIPALHGAVLVGGLLQNAGCTTVTETPYFDGMNFSPAGQLVTPRMNHTVTPILAGRGLVAIGGAYFTGPCRATPLNTVETMAISQLGDACSSDVECVTSHCADGVCCNEACPHPAGSTTECQSCSKEGMCLPSPQGTACGGSCSTAVCDGTRFSCPSSSDASVCDGGPEGGPDAMPEASDDGPPPTPPAPTIDAAPSTGPTDREAFVSCAVRSPRPDAGSDSLPWLLVASAAFVGRRACPRRRARGTVGR